MIVGWSMAETMESRLVVDALEMAVARRRPGAGCWPTPTAAASTPATTTSGSWRRHGITCSMSAVGQCWDNAPVESFFARLKREVAPADAVHHPRAGARASIFEYIEVLLQPRPPALLAGVRLPGGVRADVQPEPPLTSCPFFVGKNYATHKHPKVRRWLARRPRFHMHFIPTSSSWLNLVERWFRDLTEKRLRRGVFRSVSDLTKAIDEYIEHHNNRTTGFTWTTQAEAILAKVRRARAVLDKTPSE